MSTPALELIGRIETSSTNFWTFSNIPQNYSSLQIFYSYKRSEGGQSTQNAMYWNIGWEGGGLGLVKTAAMTGNGNLSLSQVDNPTSSQFYDPTYQSSCGHMEILDYADTANYKGYHHFIGNSGAASVNGHPMWAHHRAQSFRNGAINSITIYSGSSTVVTIASVSLYGVL